jgi:PadR family transcriptional regulator
VTENGRRAKYYSLTTRGRASLAKATKDWQRQAVAISRILKASLEEL